MITKEQEDILSKGLKFKRLAEGGDFGEAASAQRKFIGYLFDFDLTIEQINEFEKNTLSGFRLEYEGKVFFTHEELLKWVGKKPLKKQIVILYRITKQLIKQRFFTATP